jgi:hypothetical protein
MTAHGISASPALRAVLDRCLQALTDVLDERAIHFDHVLSDALRASFPKLKNQRGRVQGEGDSFGQVFARQFRTRVSAELSTLLAEDRTRQQQREQQREQQRSPAAALTLELLSVEDSEMQALKSLLTSQLAANTEAELKLLNRNLAALLERDEAPLANSPFRPSLAIEAGLAALEIRGFQPSVARELVQVLARELVRPLLLIYQSINALFGTQPVTQRPRQQIRAPAADAKVRPAANEPASAPTPTAAGTSPDATGQLPFADASSPYPAPAPAADPQLIALLVRLLATSWRAPAPAFAAPGNLPVAGAAAALGPGAAPAAAAPAARDGPGDAEAAGLSGSLAGLSMLSDGQPGDDFADELKLFVSWRAGIRELLTDVPRRVAFDLVTSVFDPVARCILVSSDFRHRTLSAQTDLLQFALQQPSAYFLCHRTVLSTVERLAITAAGTSDPQGRLAVCWDEAITLLLQFVAQPAARKAQLQDAVHQAELQAAALLQENSGTSASAARQALSWMQRVAPREAKASFLREFLLWTWSRTLVLALLDRKDSAVLTPRYLKAARTSAWSVQKLRTDEQRNHLRRAIPDLFRVLKEGMRAVRLDKQAEVAFLARLVEAHRYSLGLDTTRPAADGRAPATPAAGAAPADADALREGGLYLLRSPTGTRQLQLQSYDADDGSCVFVSMDGNQPLFLSSESVALVLRDGTLRRCDPTAAQPAPASGHELGPRFERLRALLKQGGR